MSYNGNAGDIFEGEFGQDIGHGVRIELCTAKAGPTSGQPIGLIYFHNNPKGGRCEGWVGFRGRDPDAGSHPSWVVEREFPLTLSPSIHCGRCGHHGWIKEGKWVPA